MRPRILEFGLIAAIFVAVGGFGGETPVPWGIAQAIVFSLGLLLVARPPANPPVPFAKLLWFPATLGAWIFAQWLASRSGRVGLDTHAIEQRGLAFATAAVAFFVALEIARERAARHRLALWFIGLGVFESFYGLAQYLAGWNYIWNVPRRYYTGSASGTYVNHNHYSGLLEMILPLALGLAFYHRRKARHRAPELRKCLLLLLAATVMLVAIVFSFSRMGVISALVSLAAMAAVVWAGRRRGPLPVALMLALVAGGLAAVSWLGAGPVVERFAQLPRNDPLAGARAGRAALWRDALPLVRAHPLAGSGLGGFEFAFTRFQTTELNYTMDHAHNDYLELAVELGLPCAALLVAALFRLAFRALQAALHAPSGLTRSLALGAFGGAAALLAHGAADFNLYIPANALVFAALLGMGYAAHLEARAASRDAVSAPAHPAASALEQSEAAAPVIAARSG